jgi:hypothetical protein
VDKQLASLLESLEVDLGHPDPPQRARRPPDVSTSPPSPLTRERAATATPDREPPLAATVVTTARPAVTKTQGVDQRRAHGQARRLLHDPVVRDRCVDIIAGVMVGLVGAFVVILFLQKAFR